MAAGQHRVVVELRVRRFRCRQPACERATFVEQVEGVTYRYGRRSQQLQAALQRLGLMLAGRAGSRLAEALAVPVSRSTLLRLIRALPEEAPLVPRVLGIDEFALRKGSLDPVPLAGTNLASDKRSAIRNIAQHFGTLCLL